MDLYWYYTASASEKSAKGMDLRRGRKYDYMADLSPVTDEEFEELLDSYNYKSPKSPKGSKGRRKRNRRQ